ncbi:hypothetical protein AB0P17_15670 [Streptomyces sp. NPDC088124]|uniref:hypothetical protein n=1 Tax=Streptomyces sp. NPDC088124 TaxID=3154654 RepID=UPI003443C84C
MKLPQRLVHAAAGSPDRSTVTGALAALGGPVIWAPACWFLALVPAGAADTWDSPHAGALGHGAYLPVPRIDRTGPAGIHWAVPVSGDRTLCSPAAVMQLLHTGRDRQGLSR